MDRPANSTNLLQVLTEAQPGDVVKCEAGNYPYLLVKYLAKAAPGVLVEPVSGAKVTFEAGIYFNQCSGFTLRGVTVLPNLTTKYGVQVIGGERMFLEELEVHGDDNIITSGIKAIWFRNARDAGISYSAIHHIFCGISHLDCVGLKIVANIVRDIGGDAIRGVSNDILIDGNKVFDFFTDPAWHTDGIQFWTSTQTVRPKNITITNNFVSVGNGTSQPQGIFMGDEANLGGYDNVVIRGNVIVGASYNAITVKGIDPVVEDNLIIGYNGFFNPKSGYLIVPRIMLRGCVGGRIINNWTPQVSDLDSTGVIEEGTIKLPMVDRGDLTQLTAWEQAHAPPADDAELIEALKKQIAEQEAQLNAMKNQLATLKEQNDLLQKQVAELTLAVQALEAEKTELIASAKARDAAWEVVEQDRQADRLALQSILDTVNAALGSNPSRP